MPKIIGNSVPPTGSRIGYTGLVAPRGWVFGAGKTIGSAASGGTERANADTLYLYRLLWNDYSNTELPIQDSAGAPSVRGASADADFAANKRMPTPDYRGRGGLGKDNLGGSAANRVTSGSSGITGTTLGASGGLQTIAQHGHGPGSLSTGSENTTLVHRHSYPASAEGGGSGGTGVSTTTYGSSTAQSGNAFLLNAPTNGGSAGAVFSSSGIGDNVAHQHSVTSGESAQTGTNISGSGHGNMTPSMVESIIIKL